MQQVNGITSGANQTLTVPLPDGSELSITLIYRESQFAWFMNVSQTPGTFELNGFQVVSADTNSSGLGNMLRQFKNQISFGLCCFTINDRNPTNLQDFVSPAPGINAASGLFLLNAADVQTFENYIASLKI